MELIPTLSIDTAYDQTLRMFFRSRRTFYDSVLAQADVHQLGQQSANRETFLKQCEKKNEDGDPYFGALAICSHGAAGVVFDDSDSPDGILFSTSDEIGTLETIAHNRTIYLFCCETGDSDLPAKLLSAGGKLIVGFKDSPAWDSELVFGLWRDMDIEILKCILFGQNKAAFDSVRDMYLDRIGSLLSFSRSQTKSDLVRMSDVLKSMVIHGV